MGIQGLLSHCLERRGECTEKVDLVEIAAQRNGIELLIDYYSFQHLLLNRFWQSIESLHHNPYLRIDGGEYGSLDAYVTKFVTDLKSLGIILVFFVDGGKGSCPDTTRQKLDTWIQRHKQDVRKLNQVLAVCSGMMSINDLPFGANVRPVLLEVQMFSTLRKCYCEVVQCVSGEADYIIAKNMVEREKAFAVVSNDSDFCIFKGSRFIPNELWDMNNDLGFGLPSALPTMPAHLMCEVITSEKLTEQLGFNGVNELIEMSIVAGNDFTGPLLRNINFDIKGRKCIKSVAAWTKQYQYVENHPGLEMEMRRNPKFLRAVEHSRNFYNLNLVENPETAGSSFKDISTSIIEEGIKREDYPANLMSMNHSFYWHRMLLEDTSEGVPCVEIVLGHLRSHIYKIVLPKHKHFVTEYGRTPWEEFRYATVKRSILLSGPMCSLGYFLFQPVFHNWFNKGCGMCCPVCGKVHIKDPLLLAVVNATDDRTVPPIQYIQDIQVFKNLKHFHHVLTHMEPAWDPNKTWFDRYGRKNGFIAYILRYFLVLNWGQNLYVTEKEFLALVAMVYGRCDENLFQPMDVRPVTRCVTLGNWFQDIYRHAYEFLGKILHLTNEFPLPKEIYSGSVWTVFYTCSINELFYKASSQGSGDRLRKVQKKMRDIIHEKRHILQYLVDGVFYLDDSW